MTTAQRTDTAHRVDLVVPDVDAAADHLMRITGRVAVATDPVSTRRVDADPGVSVGLITADPSVPAAIPRVVDLGTHHLCWRVTDIDAAAEYIDTTVEGATILGDVITVPDGPIAGNRWVYYRSPWGVLFELQQWPTSPPYLADTDVRLDHTRHVIAESPLPGFAGVDHSGYSVADLEQAIAVLTAEHGARLALRTEIEAGREFMSAQFGIDVSGTSAMAMLDLDGLTLELFEHRVDGRRPFPSATAIGGHRLTPRGRTADLSDVITGRSA